MGARPHVSNNIVRSEDGFREEPAYSERRRPRVEEQAHPADISFQNTATLEREDRLRDDRQGCDWNYVMEEIR